MAGSCGVRCDAGYTLCDGECVDTKTDARHCGACDNACSSSGSGPAQCTNGSCGMSCAPGLMACGEKCVNTASDKKNCGGCGVKCDGDSMCLLGLCL